MPKTKILIQKAENAKDLPLPAYATASAAGLDLCANIPEDVCLKPGERALIPCGIHLALPLGCEAQIRARSGLALKHGLGVLNAPATIDADYRGEIKVILINWGEEPFTLKRGERIAQLVICAVLTADLCETTALPESIRGEGGFGHTGR